MEHGRTDLPQDVTPRSPAPAMIAHEAAANSAQQPATPPDAILSLGALPQNLESATDLIAQLAASNVELQDSRQQLTQEIEELKLLVTKLLLRLQGHRSERVADDPNQLKLDFQDGAEAQDALADASADAEQLVQEYLVRRKQAKPKPQRNEKLPEHLPRYDVELPVLDEVQNCPTHGPRVRIGEDVTETLEFERPKLKVRRTIIPKFACPKESECGVQSPDRPAGLVEGNRYDTSVAAEIITGKYGYHLPIYREQDYFAGSGWNASRSTLLNIMTAAAELLEPFYRYLCDEVRTDSVLGTDDTSVTLILPPEVPPVHADDPRSQRVHEVISKARDEGRTTVAAKMWAYRGVELPINVFDFSVSRHRDGPDDFLRDYSGTLMADCYGLSNHRTAHRRADSSRGLLVARAAQGVRCARQSAAGSERAVGDDRRIVRHRRSRQANVGRRTARAAAA